MPFDVALRDPGDLDVRLQVMTVTTTGTAGQRRESEVAGARFWASVREASPGTVGALVRAGRSEAIGAYTVETYHDYDFAEGVRLKDLDGVYSRDPEFRLAVVTATGAPGQLRRLVCRTLKG